MLNVAVLEGVAGDEVPQDPPSGFWKRLIFGRENAAAPLTLPPDNNNGESRQDAPDTECAPVVSKNTNEPKSVIPEGVFVARKNYRLGLAHERRFANLTSAPGSSAERVAPSSYAASR